MEVEAALGRRLAMVGLVDLDRRRPMEGDHRLTTDRPARDRLECTHRLITGRRAKEDMR